MPTTPHRLGLLPAFLLASALGAQTPVQQHGHLSVSGNRIVDGSGANVSLPGMSLFWSNTGWGGEAFYNAAAIQWARSDWGIEVVRAAMGVEDPGGYLADPSNKAKVQAVVDAAVQEGIYVIIDWHSHQAEHYEADAVAFFTEMATQYGHLPNVIYEVYNEPLDPGSQGAASSAAYWSDTIRPYSENVIDAIRAVDPDNLIIVGSPTWSQDVDVVAQDPIVGRTNVAYTLHFYAGTHTGWLRQKALVALNSGLALFVTEWGTVEANAQGSVATQSVSDWMDFLCEHEISHCNWSLNDKDEPASALIPGASSTGGWQASELTASGALVKSLIEGWDTYCLPAATASVYGVGCPTTEVSQIEADSYVAIGGGAAALPSTDPADPTGQVLTYSAVGDYTVYAGVSLPAASEFLIEVRYSSGTGATLQLEEGGGTPLYSLLELPASSGWQTHSALVDLSAANGVISPALAFSSASPGPVTVNWLRITDLSTALTLNASGGPVLGSTWALSATGLEANAGAALYWFGDASYVAGINLAALGGAGCYSYSSANLAVFPAPASGGASSYSLNIPSSTSLTGFQLSVQATAGSSSLAMGFATSNGLLGVVGF